MHIKDAVVNFFYNQGITIVTIQPEFKIKSDAASAAADDDNNKQVNGMSIVQCLIGCQSLECAPKTCCSTNDLQLILSHDGDEQLENATTARKVTKDKTGSSKSRSLLSLNVTSLMKLRRFAGSTQDIMKKCASESHVTRIGDDSVDSDNGGGGGDGVSGDNESKNPSSTANNSQLIINSSIDELKEIEFHKQCGERSEKRMPTQQHLTQSHPIESLKQCEDSSLLKKSSIDDCNESNQEIDSGK